MRKMIILFLAFGFLAGGMISAQDVPEAPAEKTPPRPGIGIVCLSYAFQLNAHEGEPIRLGDTKYEKGIYAHAPSELHIHLPKPGVKFTAMVGPDAGNARGDTSVQFFVFLRGKCVFQSDVLREDCKGVPVQVELDGATEFILTISEAGGNWNDHSVWADAKVEYADETTEYLSELPYFMQANEENIQAPGELPPAVFVTAGGDATVKIWDFADGRLLRTVSRDARNYGRVKFSPDGKYLAMISEDAHAAYIVEAETAKIVKKLVGHLSNVSRVDWAADGKYVVTVSADRTVRVWDVEQGGERFILIGYPGNYYSLACSPDGETIAVGGEDKTIWLWDIQEGKLLQVLTNRRGMGDIPALKFSPDGRFLATGGSDKSVTVWNVETGKVTAEMFGCTEKVECVNFSPDGKLVACGSWDHTIYIWEAETGTPRGVLRGHEGPVFGVQFTADGKRLISCGHKDGSVRIWDVETKKCLKVLLGHSSAVTDVMLRGE